MNNGENMLPDLEARKRDHKVYITDEAIAKVPFIRYKGISEEHYGIIQYLAKEVLRISKEQNDSNEVAIVFSLDWKTLQDKGQDFTGISIGDEHSVDPTESTIAYHLVHNTLQCIVICLHNHPNLSKLSLDDVKFFLMHRTVKMLVAITNLGSISYLVKSDNFDWDIAVEIYNEAVSKHNLNHGDLNAAQEAANYFLKNCHMANLTYSYR